MATHDYVIANGTGAAVRADLNNALAAIASNNSGTSEPATTYAYQWWADTTNNLLKLRNSANNAWITLRELDGTLLMEDGSNSAPGLSFASDTNTGFFSGGADKIGFATGGVERLEIGSSEVVFNDPSNDVDFRVESNGQTHMLFVDAGNDRVGVGTSSPSYNLVVSNGGASGIEFGPAFSGTANLIQHYNRSGAAYVDAVSEAAQHRFQISGSEKARIDSSGRLLVGSSTARSNFFNSSVSSLFQIEGTSSNFSRTASIINNSTSDDQAILILGKSSGASLGSNTLVASGNTIGSVSFQGNDGSEFIACASIDALIDGTPGSNDMPGRLVFSTCADGASSPTERLRIDSEGRVHAGGTGALQLGTICSRSTDGSSPSNDGNQRHTLVLGSTETAGLNVGPAIYFYGKTNNNTASYGFAGIQGCKGSTASNNYTGHLRFFTQNSGGAGDLTEMCRITQDGLTFNGDTAAANALDDYEEGDFTPSWGLGLTNPSYVTQSGKYTKIGRTVYFTLQISTNGGTANSSGARIDGLPFNAIGTSVTGGAFVNYMGGWAIDTPFFYKNQSDGTISLYAQSTGAALAGNAGNGLANVNLYVMGFYLT